MNVSELAFGPPQSDASRFIRTHSFPGCSTSVKRLPCAAPVLAVGAAWVLRGAGGGRAVPRYHFDLRDGDAFVLDEEGTELPDIESDQMEAAEFLSDTVKELTMRRSDPSAHSPWPLSPRPSTTLVDLFTLLLFTDLSSTIRASLRSWSNDEFDDGVAYGWQARLRWRPVDSFFSGPLVRGGDAGGTRRRSLS